MDVFDWVWVGINAALLVALAAGVAMHGIA